MCSVLLGLFKKKTNRFAVQICAQTHHNISLKGRFRGWTQRARLIAEMLFAYIMSICQMIVYMDIVWCYNLIKIRCLLIRLKRFLVILLLRANWHPGTAEPEVAGRITYCGKDYVLSALISPPPPKKKAKRCCYEDWTAVQCCFSYLANTAKRE